MFLKSSKKTPCRHGGECSHLNRVTIGSASEIDRKHMSQFVHPVIEAKPINTKEKKVTECMYGSNCSHYKRVEAKHEETDRDISHCNNFTHPAFAIITETKTVAIATVNKTACRNGCECSLFSRVTDERNVTDRDIQHCERFSHDTDTSSA